MTSPEKNLTLVRREKQEQESRPLNFNLIQRVFGFSHPYAFRRNVLLCIVLLRSCQLPLLAWAIGAVLAGPISRLDLKGIALGTLAYAALAVFQQYTLTWRSYLALELGERVIHDIRDSMFRHMHSLTMSFFNRSKLGRSISRFTSDAEAMRVGVQDVLFVSLVNLGQMIVAAVVMALHDIVLFSVILAMAPIMMAINSLFRRKMSTLYRESQESFSRITATLAESVKGIRVTQGFARQEMNADLFEDLVTDHSLYNLRTAQAHGIYLPLLEVNSQLFTAMILLVGGYRVFAGSVGVEDLYHFVMMTAVFFGPVTTLGNQYNHALSAMAGAERVFQFLDRKPDWQDATPSVSPEITGRIEFDHVTFGYDPAKPVLHDVSFTMEAGKTIALTGQTGSGKTTIINLISKFYLPTSGRILIDGTDISMFDTNALHRQMGIVLQQNFLFSGTIADNIRVGKPNATMEEIVKAAKQLDCLDILAAMSEGFLTVVGEGGSGISLGQRQLICFTRAMLANPRILILDEATSAVDTMTEARVQKALSILLKGRTSIVVAHRLSTIRNADLVIVLDAGKIVESGTHRQLLKNRRHYAALYRRFIS
jgi:ABC-type multidrug transport system fused ATPase/permease subunit